MPLGITENGDWHASNSGWNFLSILKTSINECGKTGSNKDRISYVNFLKCCTSCKFCPAFGHKSFVAAFRPRRNPTATLNVWLWEGSESGAHLLGRQCQSLGRRGRHGAGLFGRNVVQGRRFQLAWLLILGSKPLNTFSWRGCSVYDALGRSANVSRGSTPSANGFLRSRDELLRRRRKKTSKYINQIACNLLERQTWGCD